MNKTKYYIFAYDQAGIDWVSFWKELSDEERDDLCDEHGTLEEAAREAAEEMGCNDLYWILPEEQLRGLHQQLSEIFGKS